MTRRFQTRQWCIFLGGLSNENLYFDRTNNGLQKYAEDYGFFLIGLAAYGVSTFFGSLIPILQTLDGIDPSADPQNPEDWPEETLAVRHLADLAGIGMLEEIFSKWNIDRKNVFGQGNSAGSNACIYFALRDPSLFNAIVPTGGFVNINFADLSKLRETPVMHIVGTEDQFGITDIKKVYQRLEELKVPLTIKIVGGGDHYFGWTKAVADIFAFMEAHVVREEMQ